MKIFNLMQIVPSLHSGGVEQGTVDLSNYLASLKIRNFIISNGGNLLSYLNILDLIFLPDLQIDDKLVLRSLHVHHP